MLFHRRRMNAVRYALLGVLFGSSVYFWTTKKPIYDYQQNLIQVNGYDPFLLRTFLISWRFNLQEATTARDVIMTFNDNNIAPIVDPLSISPCVVDNPTETNQVKSPIPIEPFPPFQTDAIAFNDLNRTLHWLDLWNGDEACTKHQVHLLKPGSQLKPGALVSFPGSGNSWLRMLLMGITGIFTSSVYMGDDAAFRSKGILLIHSDDRTLWIV